MKRCEVHIVNDNDPVFGPSPEHGFCGASLDEAEFINIDFYEDDNPIYLSEDERYCPSCVALYDAGVRG